MTTTTIDYTNINATDDGTEQIAALKLEFQHAQTDMVLKPNEAGTETISGSWTFSSNLTVSSGATSLTNGAIGEVPLKVTGITGTTVDLLQVFDVATKVLDVDSAGKTTASDLVGTNFCMGDVTTPVGTYATVLDVSAGESLATTQAILDHVLSALASIGLITEA